ncbi:MAG: hypothetical protein HRF48_00255 [Chloroflexota bacterium]|jgi:hypothetical protein
MSTFYHTPISFGALRSTAAVNTPLGSLDQAIRNLLSGVAAFDPGLLIKEVTQIPDPPAAAGRVLLFALNKVLYTIDDGGTVRQVDEVSGGKVRVRRTTDQVITPTAETVVQFATVDEDKDSEWDAVSYAVKPKRAGYYWVRAQIGCFVTTPGTVAAYINLNGSHSSSGTQNPVTQASVITTAFVEDLVQVTTPSSDLITVTVLYANALTLKAPTYLYCHLVP